MIQEEYIIVSRHVYGYTHIYVYVTFHARNSDNIHAESSERSIWPLEILEVEYVPSFSPIARFYEIVTWVVKRGPGRPARRGKREKIIRVENFRPMCVALDRARQRISVASRRRLLLTYRHRIKYSPKDGKQEYRPEVVEEQPIRHEVAGVQDDGRQHVQEERVRRQRRHVNACRLEQQEADNHADGDQQTGLREDLAELRRHVEA